MDIFSIRDIENLTGIKAHTLRAWEKRYGIIVPPTAPGKHRMYDNNDLKHILRIASLYHKGMKISKIAEMSFEEIQKKTQATDTRSNFEAFVEQLLEYTFDGNEAAFKKLMAELREMMGEINIYLHVIFPFLTKIGELWLTDKITPVHEHFASNIIRNELMVAIDKTFSRSPLKEPKLLLFCPPHEQHEIPLLFCHFILRSRKINSIYLGSNVSEDILKSVVEKKEPEWLLVYLITNFTDEEIEKYIADLSKKFGKQKIMFCGPGFKNVVGLEKNASISKGIHDLVNFCNDL
jgi:DNA-binding transcriptional MerR regulator